MAELKYIDGYPEYMRESIETVNRTRGKRRDSTPPAMTKEEREEVLQVHPDYAPGGKRELSVGPNAGDTAPTPVADLLEAYPLVEEGEVDLGEADYEVDVLIIGGGLAGTTAAIWAHDKGIPKERILLVTKLRHGDCNSIMAEGGTQVADRPVDSPDRHFLDTVGGGHFANKPDVVRRLVEDAPTIMHWLEELGAVFDKEDNGDYVEKWGGGTSIRRLHSCRDYTGLEEFRVIRDEFRSRQIPCLEHYPAIELTTDAGGRANSGTRIPCSIILPALPTRFRLWDISLPRSSGVPVHSPSTRTVRPSSSLSNRGTWRPRRSSGSATSGTTGSRRRRGCAASGWTRPLSSS